MMSAEKPDLRALVFDAYGTIFDVFTVRKALEEEFGPRGADVAGPWREKQLQYTWLVSMMGRYVDFRVLTAGALVHVCRSLGLPLSGSARERIMESYLRLGVHADVAEALERLGDLRLAILSNGEPRMLDAVVDANRLADRFPLQISADAVRAYKPDPRVYQSAVDRLGLPKERIGLVSSNAFDVVGGASFGFWTCWLNRRRDPPEELGIRPSVEVQSLGELAALLLG